MRIDNIQVEGTGSGTGTVPLATNLSTLSVSGSNGSYIDIGDVRYQWGTNTNAITTQRTVTLPVAFRDTNYSVTANVVDQSDTSDRPVSIGTRGTTTFLARPTTNGNGSASPFNWIAIGLKP